MLTERTDGIEALELWDAPVDGRPLQAWRHDPTFPRRLATLARARLEAEGAQAVVLTGGGAARAQVDAMLELGLHSTIADDPLYLAARGGRHLVQPVAVLCADLGQTSLKLHDGRRGWRVERDLARAPRLDDVPPARRAAARDQTLRWIAQAIGQLEPTATLVLGVPAELGPEGWPLACTYVWDDPDPRWRDDLAAALGLAPACLHLINDAVMAAAAVDRWLGPAPREATLVLTIGYGVGAAVLPARP